MVLYKGNEDTWSSLYELEIKTTKKIINRRLNKWKNNKYNREKFQR